MPRKNALSPEKRTEVVLALLRKEDTIANLARRYGVSEQSLYRWREEFVAEYVELRKHKGMTPEKAAERVALPHFFGALAVRAGEAVGMVSGLNRETKPFIPAFEIVKVAKGSRRVSSVFVMTWPDKTYFYADCSVNIAPDAETLAEIGRATARSARVFGHEPRVAFLSFSTRDRSLTLSTSVRGSELLNHTTDSMGVCE